MRVSFLSYQFISEGNSTLSKVSNDHKIYLANIRVFEKTYSIQRNYPVAYAKIINKHTQSITAGVLSLIKDYHSPTRTWFFSGHWGRNYMHAARKLCKTLRGSNPEQMLAKLIDIRKELIEKKVILTVLFLEE